MQSGNGRVRIEAMTSCCSPEYVDSTDSIFSADSFDGASDDVCFIEFRKIVGFNVLKNSCNEGLNSFVGKHVRIELSDSGEYFFLLKLIVEDGHFLSIVIFELTSRKRISHTYCDCF